MNKFVSKLLPLFLLLFAAVPAFGQSKFGAITAASTDCSVANSCVSLLLNQAAGGATITLTGTWSATLNFEVSGDNGVTWAAASTASSTAIGVTNISVAGYTNLRVRCNPFTSGTVNVTIYSGTGSIRSGSSSSGATAASPVMGYYLSNNCAASNIGNCYQTFGDTLQTNLCAWTNASTTVTCLTNIAPVSAAVAANVATYTYYSVVPSNWVIGNSVTITGFTAGDVFFNQTCTITATAASTVSCALVHADASSTTSGTVANNSVGPFTSADVGKTAMGFAHCHDDMSSAATSAGAISTTATVTISGFTSSTQVTLSGTPANTATASTSFPMGACFIYGHLDDTGASTVDTAMQSAAQCPKLFMASANYFFASPHFFNNPPACTQIGPGLNGNGTGGFGNTTLPAGFDIEGRGVGNTAWYLTPSFPNGDACAHKPTPTAINSGCFVIPVMGKWSDFRIDGGSQGTAPNLNGKNLIYAAIATMMNFTCTNVGPYNTTLTGIQLSFTVYLSVVNNSGCGGSGIATDAGTGGGVGTRVVVENSTVHALWLQGNGNFTCYWCDLAMATTALNNVTVLNGGANLRLFGGNIIPANFFPTTNTGITAYQCTSANGSLYADSVLIDFNHGGSTNNAGVWNTAAGCTATLINTTITAQSGAFSYSDNSSGVLNIDGSSTFTQPFSNANITGNINADGHSMTGSCTGVATASSTLGLYGTGPNETITTCTSAAVGTGTPMTQARTLSTLQCRSSATTVSVACTVLVNGAPSALTCTMTAATSCNDFTHTVAVVKGDLISERIVTGAAETGANVTAQFMW